MKTYIVILPLVTLSLVSCKKSTRAITMEQKPSTNVNAAVTSINAMKNGLPFINYLGIKVEGC
jgi:hypothetical protein